MTNRRPEWSLLKHVLVLIGLIFATAAVASTISGFWERRLYEGLIFAIPITAALGFASITVAEATWKKFRS